MTDLVIDATCRRHLGVAAVGNCAHCGKPFCTECRFESITTESDYCSADCRDVALQTSLNASTSEEALLAGYQAPIRTGAGTWVQAFGSLNVTILPLSVLAALLAAIPGWSLPTGSGPAGKHVLALIVLAVFGAASVSIVLSGAHTGQSHGPALLQAAKRFVPWLLTWLLMLGMTIVGYVLLIVPGIYWNMRVFWADEFALVHRTSPFQALDESWKISRDQAGKTFALEFVLGFVLVALLSAFGFTLVTLYAAAEPAIPFAQIGNSIFFGMGLHLFLLIYAFVHAIHVSLFYALRQMASRSIGAKSGKHMPRLLQWASVPAAAVFAALAGLTVLMETGDVPSDRVLAGADVPAQQYEALLAEGIIAGGEKVEYFYSEGLWSVLEGGSILTDRRVIAYESGEDEQIQIYEIYLEDIAAVDLVQQGDTLSFSVYEVRTADDEYWLHLWLPAEYDDDKRFVRAVQAKIRQ